MKKSSHLVTVQLKLALILSLMKQKNPVVLKSNSINTLELTKQTVKQNFIYLWILSSNQCIFWVWSHVHQPCYNGSIIPVKLIKTFRLNLVAHGISIMVALRLKDLLCVPDVSVCWVVDSEICARLRQRVQKV